MGNTPTICRTCYVHPGVLVAYVDGAWLSEDWRIPAAVAEEVGLRPNEAHVLAWHAPPGAASATRGAPQGELIAHVGVRLQAVDPPDLGALEASGTELCFTAVKP
jgi:hypothetical protein